jgi:hypothetical protein
MDPPAAVALLGLALGISHHPSLFFLAPPALGLLLWLDRGLLRRPGWWLRAAGIALLGLSPLLYLPLRAAAGAPGAPADLATWGGFANHVLALGFRGDFFGLAEPSLLGQRLVVILNVLTLQFHPLLVAAMAGGVLVLIRRRPLYALLLGGTLLLFAIASSLYRAPQTVEYMMPAYVPAVLLLGYGAGRLGELAARPGARTVLRVAAGGLAAALLVVALGQGAANWGSFRWLSQDRTARDHARPILDGAPAGATILADWHWVSPLLYLQEVEGQRPDLEIRYVFPTAEPYAETWARRIGEGLAAGAAVVSTHRDDAAFAGLPPAVPLGEALLFGGGAVASLPEGMNALEAMAGSGVRVVGYELEEAEVEIGREVGLILAWEAEAPADGLTLFAHLVGADGALLAQHDQVGRPQPAGISQLRFGLTPRWTSPPGPATIVIGAYRDVPAEAGLAIAQVELRPSSFRPASRRPAHRPLADGTGRILTGWDWDQTLPGRTRLYLHWLGPGGYQSTATEDPGAFFELPAWTGPWGLEVKGTRLRPRPGEQTVPFGQGIVWLGSEAPELAPGRRTLHALRFASSRPVLRDLVVSVRLVGYQEDGRLWAWWDLSDGVPALGAVPTLKWIAGSRIRDPHWLAPPADAPAGQHTEVLLRLYDAFTGEPVPILDERIGQDTPWVPLGRRVLGDGQ